MWIIFDVVQKRKFNFKKETKTLKVWAFPALELTDLITNGKSKKKKLYINFLQIF